ncbi:MAG TPA: dihydrodipicolinate synthase family protein [Bryobacteraceae bacterium]|jgi:dihydrodipicolinate synthase/N-acetylneuraminate lyase|nr:dihydrodipicolinate synthase family protein [Bryobacteraceae bacterium]
MPEGSPPLASGVYAALATPRRPNSIEADTAALLDYLDAVSNAGVNGLVLFGSTGEFIHFELEERMRAAGLAIKRSRVPVLINTSHSTLAGALSLSEHAADAGASGILLTPPYFYHYRDAQIFEFYRQFLAGFEAGLPIYLYNLAPFLNPIQPALAGQLLETGSFAGIKDSSGDWQQFEQLSSLRSRIRFQLLVGNECVFLGGRSANADGIISGVAAAVPELLVALDRAITSCNAGLAESLDQKLREFLGWIERFPSTLAIRQAAALRGWSLRETAVPVDPKTATELDAFREWFRSWLPGVLAMRT